MTWSSENPRVDMSSLSTAAASLAERKLQPPSGMAWQEEEAPECNDVVELGASEATEVAARNARATLRMIHAAAMGLVLCRAGGKIPPLLRLSAPCRCCFEVVMRDGWTNAPSEAEDRAGRRCPLAATLAMACEVLVLTTREALTPTQKWSSLKRSRQSQNPP